MLAVLESFLPACLSGGLFGLLAWRADAGRRASQAMVATFLLGLVAGAIVHVAIGRAGAVTGLSVRVTEVGETGALVFLFLVAEPLAEVAKVVAVWPALLSRRLLCASDGILMAASSSLGFAAAEMSWGQQERSGAAWLLRAILALPGHVFFACAWGAALGDARAARRSAPIFPLTFVGVIVAHGLYEHLVYARGPGSLLALLPLLAAMVPPSLWMARLLGKDRAASRSVRSGLASRWARLSEAFPPANLATVRQALAQNSGPLNVWWVLFGTLVVLGGMFVGVGAGVLAARWLSLDLAAVDDRSVLSATPLLLLALGLFVSLPMSGWLVARARGRRSLLEPALSVSLALGITVVGLGLVAPVAMVFALALSPLAWVASCAGAWFGRTA